MMVGQHSDTPAARRATSPYPRTQRSERTRGECPTSRSSHDDAEEAAMHVRSSVLWQLARMQCAHPLAAGHEMRARMRLLSSPPSLSTSACARRPRSQDRTTVASVTGPKRHRLRHTGSDAHPTPRSPSEGRVEAGRLEEGLLEGVQVRVPHRGREAEVGAVAACVIVPSIRALCAAGRQDQHRRRTRQRQRGRRVNPLGSLAAAAQAARRFQRRQTRERLARAWKAVGRVALGRRLAESHVAGGRRQAADATRPCE